MKRLTMVLGRGGTTLIAISLALLLVSFVPQPQYSQSSGSAPLSPERFTIAFSQADLTPQDQLEITVTVEGTIKIYLLEISNPAQILIFRDDDFNITEVQQRTEELERMVQEILDGPSDKIVWERNAKDGKFTRIYIPTKVINTTVVIYNPSSETANVEHSISLKSSLAPTEKVQTIAYVTGPIGILLAIPWLLDSWKQRKHK